jgi:hypothetical protein
LGSTINFLSGAAGNGLRATIKYLRGAAEVCLGMAIKYLRHSTSGFAGNGLATRSSTCAAPRALAGHHDEVPEAHNKRRLRQRPGTTIKHLVNQYAGAGNNWAKVQHRGVLSQANPALTR